MTERTVVGVIFTAAAAGVILLFALFAGPNRADRPSASSSTGIKSSSSMLPPNAQPDIPPATDGAATTTGTGGQR
jgi:hypothetical protein